MVDNVIISEEDSNIKIVKLNEFLLKDVSKNIPFGKVLILSTPSIYFEKGITLKEELEAQDNKVISIILEENFILSVEDVCGIFNANEEIRAVIALDYRVFSAAEYFGSLKNIKCYLCSYSFPLCFGLEDTIYIKNQSSIDKFNLNINRLLLIDRECDKRKDFYKIVITYLAEKGCKAIDCYVKSVFIDKEDVILLSNLLSTLLEIILSAENKTKLIYKCIDLEKYFLQSKWSNYLSAVSVAKFLANSNDSFYFSFKILEIYCNAAVNSSDCYKIVDYRTRLERLIKLFPFNERNILNEYVQQAKTVRERINILSGIFNKIVGDLQLINTAFSGLKEKFKINNYLCEENQAFRDAVIFSGDTPLSFNGMSVIRELNYKV